MAEYTDTRKTKERSPTFPFISLESAIERARQFYSQEKRGSAPFPVAAKHWGYSPSSSGAVQTASALKNYGLMSDEGSGINRKFKLTELALRILLDMRPDSTERIEYMRQASLTPNVASSINEKWGEDLPSDATLNHYLVLELGFSQSNAIKTTEIIKKNHELTNSSKSDYLSINTKTVDLDDLHLSEVSLEDFAPAHSKHYPSQPTERAAMRTERVIDPDGIDILLQFNGEPSIASYEFIKDYIELRIKAIQRANKASKDKIVY